MNTLSKIFFAAVAVAGLAVPSALAAETGHRGKIISQGEGGVCYEQDARDDEAYLKKAEVMEKAGKLKEAFAAAEKGAPYGCWDNAQEHIAGIIERTYKKLGQKAEKTGRFEEAHNYFIYPWHTYIAPGYYRDRFEKNYSLADADRTMLAYAKANPDNYEIVEKAVGYFKSFDKVSPKLKEVYVLVTRGGDKMMTKEDKDFAARKYDIAIEDLKDSRRWYGLMEDDKRIQARAKQRGDALLAENSYDSIERAFNYVFEFSSPKLDRARARAEKLGQAAEQKGDLELAERFYSLAGDDARHDAVVKRQTAMEERKEKRKQEAESKRQDQFDKDQKSLEDELGF